ncbi:MAG: SURF1 family protein [Chloroflexota bacterium]
MKLRPLLLTLFVAIAASIMIGLGLWQLSRLQERRARNAEIVGRMNQPPITVTGAPLDATALEYRRVAVTGTFDFSQEVILRNKSKNESPGVHLLTPLKIDGSEDAVLIDRGWIPYTASDPQLRTAYATPTGVVTVSGLLRASQPRLSPLLPADPALGPGLPRLDSWFWTDVDQIQKQIPYPLLPFFVEQSAGPDPTALPLAGSEIDLSNGPHLSYAIQWFSFATILVVGSIVLARQRSQPPRG